MNPLKQMSERRHLNVLAALSYMSVIFIISSIPSSGIPGGVSPYSGFFHFMEYFILAILLFPIFYNNSNRLFYVLFIATFYGVTDEIHQFFVPGRVFSTVDMFLDLAGATAGVFVCWLNEIIWNT
ncbi:MAG: hypothetical protein GF416_08650 [Candidatus Altiarchaeales archaeon]|nr:hypothetical protein [Candidatus Altiarchaeales archaeon]MBD3417185.1 hypothetical protein [Candidatus Altiarchaeales archaeon]